MTVTAVVADRRAQQGSSVRSPQPQTPAARAGQCLITSVSRGVRDEPQRQASARRRLHAPMASSTARPPPHTERRRGSMRTAVTSAGMASRSHAPSPARRGLSVEMSHRKSVIRSRQSTSISSPEFPRRKEARRVSRAAARPPQARSCRRRGRLARRCAPHASARCEVLGFESEPGRARCSDRRTPGAQPHGPSGREEVMVPARWSARASRERVPARAVPSS